MQKGLVIKSTGSWYDILGEDNALYKGRMRGKIRLLGLKVTNPIAVGDIVFYDVEDKEDKIASINTIEKRKNYMIRSATQKKEHGHILAANIDHALLVATLAFPRTSMGFIDRFLVSTEAFRIPATILFNKADILDEDSLDYQNQLMELYKSLGYNSFAISALYDENFEQLLALLQGQKTFVAGHSGVGKSTLVNRLIPDLHQKTAEISDFSSKGVHTTTFAEMFFLNENSCIIDTPGIKELGLWQIGEKELSHYFPEMRDRLNACKYHNCTHTHEPGCAIKKAVEDGLIAVIRYESYISMFGNEDNRK